MSQKLISGKIYFVLSNLISSSNGFFAKQTIFVFDDMLLTIFLDKCNIIFNNKGHSQ